MLKNLWDSLSGSSFWSGFIASALVALIGFGIKQLIELLNTKSPLTGYWYSLIFEDGKVVKSDWYYLRHNSKTGEIVGKMERLYPETQKGRHWEVSGMLSRPNLTMFSHSKELNSSMASTVCRLTGDNFFAGHYLRYSETKKAMETIEICYKKVLIDKKTVNKKAVMIRLLILIAMILISGMATRIIPQGEFGREKMPFDLTKGTFYGVEARPSRHYCNGGIVTNGKAEVVNDANKPIEGLYAAGEVTFHSAHPASNALTFGMIAAEQVIARLSK